MATPDLASSAPLASFAAVLKNLVTIAGCAVGLLLLFAAATLLIELIARYFKTPKAKFGIKPFLVAPELEGQIGKTVEASLRAELRRAFILKSRRFRTSHETDGVRDARDIEIVAGAPDSSVRMFKSSLSDQDRTDDDVHDVVRGLRYTGFNPVVRRLKEIKFEVDDHFLVSGSIVANSEEKSFDIVDAVVIDAGSTKILPFKILMWMRSWKPTRHEVEVCGDIRLVGGCLRVTATLNANCASRWRRSVPSLRWGRARPGRPPDPAAASASYDSEPRPAGPVVYECSIGVEASTDLHGRAAMVGFELAHKLLAGKQNAEWQALEHYINAVSSYDHGLSRGDPAMLRQAVEHATKAFAITSDFENLPDLMIAVSDVLSTLHEVDAAEQALRIIPLHGSHAHGTTGRRRDEARLLKLSLRTLVRLGVICYQKGDYTAGQFALRQAQTVSTQREYIKRKIYPILAANLARSEEDPPKAEAAKLLREHLEYKGKSGCSQWWRDLGDHLAKVSLFGPALQAYEEGKKVAPASSYLPWRCGVMHTYLASGLMKPKENRFGAPEANLPSAIKHLRWADKNLSSASRGVEAVALLPGRRYGSDTDLDIAEEADAWCKLEALNDLAIMWSSAGVLRSARASDPKASARAKYYHGKARKYIEHARILVPNEWDIQYNLGLIRQRALETDGEDPGERDGSYGDVKRAYKAAMRLAPTEVLPHLALARLLEREGAHEMALEHFTTARTNAAARRDFDVRASVTLCAQGQARVLEKLARFGEAADILQVQVASDPNTPELHQYLGFLKLKQAISTGERDCDQALWYVRRSRDIIASMAVRQGGEQADRAKVLMQHADELEGNIHRWTGRPKLAELYFERCKSWSEYACASLSAMAYTAGDHGAADERARKTEEMQKHQAKDRGHAPKAKAYYRACVAALIGRTDKALDELQTALLWQPMIATWARSDPDLERVAGNARFKALVHSRKPSAKPQQFSGIPPAGHWAVTPDPLCPGSADLGVPARNGVVQA